MVKANSNKRPLIGYIISLVCGILLIAMVVVLLIHYQKAKFATTLDLSFAFAIWDLIIIAVLGMATMAGYLVSVVKSGVKKTKYTVTLVVIIFLAVALLIAGILGINSRYRKYSTWTRENWASASSNHNYRGLLSKSFMEQYDIVGYTKDQVGDLLGSPDKKTIVKDFDPKPHAAVKDVGREKWIYDLGIYYDFMDPSTLEIYFDSEGIVYSVEIVGH